MSKDFRNTKIRIKSEEHSKALQEAMIEAGARWCGSGKLYKQNLKFIYVNEDLLMTHAGCSTLFEEHTHKEIQFPIPIKGHVHAESMALYAEDAKTHAEPWKLWQVKADDGVWWDCDAHPRWANDTEYRRKPKTHTVHGVEIPDLRVSPKYGEYYYLANPVSSTYYTVHKFIKDDTLDIIWVERGLAYQHTEEGSQAAILHSKAMLGIAYLSNAHHTHI